MGEKEVDWDCELHTFFRGKVCGCLYFGSVQWTGYLIMKRTGNNTWKMTVCRPLHF